MMMITKTETEMIMIMNTKMTIKMMMKIFNMIVNMMHIKDVPGTDLGLSEDPVRQCQPRLENKNEQGAPQPRGRGRGRKKDKDEKN